MSNAAKATNEIKSDVSENMSAFDLNHSELGGDSGYKNSRMKNTLFSLAGGLIGVGVTSLSPRANKKTLGVTGAFAALNVLDTFINKPLHENIAVDTAGHVGVSLAKAASVSLFGMVTNLIIGDKPVEKEEATEEEIEIIITEETGLTSSN